MTASIEAAAIAAVLSLARLPEGTTSEEVARLETFGKAIAQAVRENPQESPFDGPASNEAAALALAAIAFHESGFREEVSRCHVKGDSGRSITAFQLMRPWAFGGYTAQELCGSTALAASQALRVLGTHARRCKNPNPASLFAAYGSGSCAKKSKASRDMCRMWERLAKQRGLAGATCGTSQPITKHEEESS